MKRAIANVAAISCAAVFLAGCEWTSTSQDESWNDRYSWINFSGLYNGINGPIVRAPSAAPAPGPTPVPGGDGIAVINGEVGGTAPAFQTVISGTLNFRPGIVPGTVTILFVPIPGGLSTGTATDDGSGNLSGTFNLVGLDDSSAQPMTGTINYNTGVWTLNLVSPGLFTDADIRISYAFDTTVGQGGGNVIEPPNGGSEAPYAGIFTMHVEQLGNKLRITDGRNGFYEGFISTVSSGGGDKSGRTSGTVEVLFHAEGHAHDGRKIKITGSFVGAYLAPTAQQEGTQVTAREFGLLQERIIQGIWIEPTGATASIHGAGGSLEVDVPATTQPTLETP